jgi:protein O-GlcNAc transferase
LGNLCNRVDNFDAAIRYYRRAVSLQPDFFEAHRNLGIVQRRAGNLDAAAASYEKAIALNPAAADLIFNLGNIYKDSGRLDEAVAAYRSALALKADFAAAYSNLMLVEQYRVGHDAQSLCSLHRGYGETFRVSDAARNSPDLSADPERPLRIGYVSGDFRDHPVGRLVAPVIAAHDRETFSVTLYSQGKGADPLTGAFREIEAKWREISALDDAAFAAQVREDEVDILVDLAGHTAHNRLPAFARRLAPVQASWLGYPSTTGLEAMDWVVTDAVHLPEGRDAEISERPVRLPQALLTFVPPDEAQTVSLPPAASGAPLTFCSFNNPVKISPAAARLWGRVMAANPGSRLLLRYSMPRNSAAWKAVLATLADAGIAANRVTIAGSAPYAEVLAAYGRADIALDPFPYSGTMTTLEALWMGVPVVALRGDTIAGRQSAALLTVAGLGELVAEDEESYVEIATGLAADPGRLAEIRTGMRSRLRASPLLDVAGFTRGLESAYRMMWRDFCAKEIEKVT